MDSRPEQEGNGVGGQGLERPTGGRSRHRLRRPQRQATNPTSQGTALDSRSLSSPIWNHSVVTCCWGFNFLLCDSFSVSKGAKENFELALEIDNMNTHARCWLAKMHFKYHVPGACKAMWVNFTSHDVSVNLLTLLCRSTCSYGMYTTLLFHCYSRNLWTWCKQLILSLLM